MATEQRGAAHWIDHFVVGTNDIGRWVEWAIDVIGVERHPIEGLTTEARNAGRPVASFMYMGDGSCHFGAFLQREQLPPTKGLGVSTPRHGFYVRAADVEAHVRRLDAHGVPHTAPARTSAEGEAGVGVHFEDPDGNQYEFWAPDDLPEGAMAVETSAGVGRISSIALGARELQRTADFFSAYCGMERVSNDDVPEDTLVLRLKAGARLVYHLTGEVDQRVIGHRPWYALHVAFTVPVEDYFSNYYRIWEGVPEWEDSTHELDVSAEEEDQLPARTGMHTSPAGRAWKKIYERGDEFYDWDSHAFHFIGGIDVHGKGSLAFYQAKEQAEYLKELQEAIARDGVPPRA
jgi:catechol 2,3-dioxygenase-like lactoylglutathione lyase family enzyme/extradiol dioxygenase family protein